MTYPTLWVRPLQALFLACSVLVGLALLFGHILPTDELALDTYQAHRRDIYLLDAPHSLNYRLTDGTTDSETPVWSPDGQQIAYVWVHGTEETIMIASASGKHLRPVFTSATGYIGTISLDWSPDSQHLAFTALLNGRQVIYVVDTASDSPLGDSLRQITSSTTDAFSPTWSPDGTYLAYSWSLPSNQQIFVASLTDLAPPTKRNSRFQQLTHTPARNSTPAWSPDGKHIAFVSNRDQNDEIYIMNPDGKNARRLTYDSANDMSPAWTPDSQRVVFTSNRTGNWEIYTIDAACETTERCTATLFQLTHNQGDKLRADWRPPTQLSILP